MNINFIDFEIRGDKRGSLVALEELKNIPFEIKSVYYMFGMKDDISRGFHAHRNLKQVAICVSGSCKFLLDNGKEKRKDIVLNAPNKGLLIESMIWREMYDFSHDCVLLVSANQYYSEKDYIRDYKKFINESLNYKGII